MEYTIRKIKESEYPLLDTFLYEAIFIPEGVEAPPRDIIYQPELQVYVKEFGTADGDGYRFPTAEAGKGSVRIYNLFNPTGIDREEAVPLTLWDFCGNGDKITAADTDGKELEVQSFGNDFGYWGHRYAKIAVFAKVPAFGYTTVIIRKEKPEPDYAGRHDTCDHTSDAPRILENDKIYAEFRCETMELTKK